MPVDAVHVFFSLDHQGACRMQMPETLCKCTRSILNTNLLAKQIFHQTVYILCLWQFRTVGQRSTL